MFYVTVENYIFHSKTSNVTNDIVIVQNGSQTTNKLIYCKIFFNLIFINFICLLLSTKSFHYFNERKKQSIFDYNEFKLFEYKIHTSYQTIV